MKIQVTGKGLKIGKNLKSHVEENLRAHVQKYFENAIGATVVIHKEAYKFNVDISVHEGVYNGEFIKTTSSDNDPYIAVFHAIICVSNKLRRYKHKLVNRKKHPKGIKALQYTIEQDFYNLDNENGYNNIQEESDTPLITEEKSIDIEFLTIAEAVMNLELLNVPALMFINKNNNQLNMIYKKEDGNVTWVEAPKALDKMSFLF